MADKWLRGSRDDTHFYIKGEKVFIYAAEFHYWYVLGPGFLEYTDYTDTRYDVM